MTFYAEAGWPAFYTIEGSVRGPGGVVIGIRQQLREKPSEDDLERLRAFAREAIGGRVVSDTLCVNACYDPRDYF
jgi:hypothetical protein